MRGKRSEEGGKSVAEGKQRRGKKKWREKSAEERRKCRGE